MSDSQRPNPPVSRLPPRPPSFEVPDLELEPVPRSLAQAPPASAPARAPEFDFGDELDDLSFERTAQPVVYDRAPRAAVATASKAPVTEAQQPWPTGRAANRVELAIDPQQLAQLADYGDPPDSAALTLAYAYRVFTRQRVLKRELLPIAVEDERAELEREATLAAFSQAVRPAIEQVASFRRLLAPLLAIEQRAAARGQALTSINAQLGAEQARLDAELAELKAQIEAEQGLEREAQRRHGDREASERRAAAKWKRVQIEMRAVTHVAEQKLGAQGGQIPEPEATQLASLQERAEALGPELKGARAELEQANQALAQVHARLASLAQSERQIVRKKQALGDAYQHELLTRSQGVSEAEIEQRAAFADLARAVLAAPGALAIPEAWLERVRNVSDRATRLAIRTEMYRRAIASYDVPRARQGVRLACTAVGLLLLLFALKLIF